MIEILGWLINALTFRITSGMEFKSFTFIFSVGLLLLSSCTQAAGSSTSFCHKPTLADMAALQKDQCYLCGDEEDRTSRVLQIHGREIGNAFSLYQKGNHEHAAVLFYAEWCPFSRIVREQFDSLSASFPSIHHIAVESSGLWPSELSQHGVRSLPTLFVCNKTQKVQFHGSRSLEAVGQYYTERTGFFPTSLSYSLIEEDNLPINQQGMESSWQKPFRAWLHENYYLAFAVVFLTLRLLLFLRPKIVTSLRQYWSLKETSWKAQRRFLRRVNGEQRHATSHFTKKREGKYLKRDDKEAGKGVLSVPSWPSSSLAAVALAECSSRGVGTEGAHEKIHLGG